MNIVMEVVERAVKDYIEDDIPIRNADAKH